MAAIALMPAPLVSGPRKPISTESLGEAARSRPPLGAATLATTSAPHGSPIVAPASVNCVVGDAGGLARAGLDAPPRGRRPPCGARRPGRGPRGARPRPSPWGLRLSRGAETYRTAAARAVSADRVSRPRRARPAATARVAARGGGVAAPAPRRARRPPGAAFVAARLAAWPARARRPSARRSGSRRAGARGAPGARHGRQRQRLAGQRHHGLRRHPHRRLAAGARVADLAARRGQRAQVGQRVARAACA